MSRTELLDAAPGATAVRWSEQIAQIGSPVPMYGVLTVPDGAAAKPFALIILNSGLLHHVGSCCLSVKLARAAASMGVTVLRYDASGIGDSAPRTTDLPQDRRAVRELREAMDYLQQTRGIERFALMGLCSGAFTSFAAALEDQRVIGVTQIAAFAYRTRGWYLRHYGARLLVFQSWRNFVLRMLGKRGTLRRGLSLQYLDDSADADWDVPDKQELERGYRALLERKVRLLTIMTGGESYAYLYRGQFRDMFPRVRFDEHFEEHYFPLASHIITQPLYQRVVLDTITQWIRRLS